jgi:hypothetical protein
MKTLAITILIITASLSMADEATKRSFDITESSNDTDVTSNIIRYRINADQKSLPPLTLEFPKGIRTRIAAVSVGNDNLNVVVQFDEFYLQSYRYTVKDSKWALDGQSRVCTLNGPLARSLRAVSLLPSGDISVIFSKHAIPREKQQRWERDLIDDTIQAKENDVVETYTQNGEGSWEAKGTGHPLRVKLESGKQ